MNSQFRTTELQDQHLALIRSLASWIVKFDGHASQDFYIREMSAAVANARKINTPEKEIQRAKLLAL